MFCNGGVIVGFLLIAFTSQTQISLPYVMHYSRLNLDESNCTRSLLNMALEPVVERKMVCVCYSNGKAT